MEPSRSTRESPRGHDAASAEFGAHDPHLTDVQDGLGQALFATHHERDAEVILLASHETLMHSWGAAHPRTLEVAAHLANARKQFRTL